MEMCHEHGWKCAKVSGCEHDGFAVEQFEPYAASVSCISSTPLASQRIRTQPDRILAVSDLN